MRDELKKKNNKYIKKMSALLEFYMKKETLEDILKTISAKQEKGVSITISVNDQNDMYGKNVNTWVSQTKEQRDQKVNRFFVGTGRCLYISELGIQTSKSLEGGQQQHPQQQSHKQYDQQQYNQQQYKKNDMPDLPF